MIHHSDAVMVFLYTMMMCSPLIKATSTDVFPTLQHSTKIISTTPKSQASQQNEFESTCMANTSVSHRVLIDTSIILTCCAYNRTALWWFNGSILFIDEESYQKVKVPNVNVTANESYSRVHIDKTNQNNTGNYTCDHRGYQSSSFFFIYLIVPISELILKVDHNTGRFYFLCYGDQQPTEPFVWNISGNTTALRDNMSNILVHNTSTGLRNASFLSFYNTGNVTVTCEHGDVSISAHAVYEGPSTESGFNPIIIAIIMGVSAVLILVVASSLYMICTYITPTSKDRHSRPSSLYSVPSISSSIDRERRGSRVSREDVTTHQEESDNRTHVLTQSDSCNSFERDVNDFGIDLTSFRSSDDYNEFWEASLCDGKFKDKIVVRNLSGKATVDLLEEFRKFQIGLGDLPSHANVWNVLGCCKDKLPYRICYEFHASTTIREYLLGNFQASDGLTENGVRQTQTLISLASGIANGMVFLKSYAFDHVALRTDKILIDQTTRCKLYDFCLSSQSQPTAIACLNESELLAWLAPELIFLEEYNQWTDIWAFGVVMWELWCGGRTPHCGKSRENLELDLRNQRFLVQPNSCPGAMYSLMLSCWKNNASERKMFTDIHTELIDLNDTSDTSWYNDYEYSSLPVSTFYTVLDNNYDKCNVSNELDDFPLELL